MVLEADRSRVGGVARGLCGRFLKPAKGVGDGYISPPLRFVQGKPARISNYGDCRIRAVVALIGNVNQPHLFALHILKGFNQFFVIEVIIIIHSAAGIKDSLRSVEKEADGLVMIQSGIRRYIVGHAYQLIQRR
ncbi:unknown [Hungatella hathewayi CAG:224]|nr:unknown [Hungatella hathewayi CAG:224]